ncbi:hypothetical protein AVEN_191591-1 [Araneus ventricosus]|uniref:Uncharacterized protein n=1 Tax=Araneus ventricosus TaxID=182803 RepID=A0A4Y2PZA8_ARAVE|nr:hypothetical protein AVEN_191591-1 [Araneus ventricosus]
MRCKKEEKACCFAISRQEPHPWSKKDPFRLAGGTFFSCGSKKLKVLIAASVCKIKLLASLFQEKEQALFLSLQGGHRQTSWQLGLLDKTTSHFRKV